MFVIGCEASGWAARLGLGFGLYVTIADLDPGTDCMRFIKHLWIEDLHFERKREIRNSKFEIRYVWKL